MDKTCGFYNQSAERKRELRASCKILGIPAGNLVIIEDSKLPDDPKKFWDKKRVAVIILKYVQQLSANVVISFDEGGVSGHLNHIAIHHGLKYLTLKKLLPPGCEVLQLKSVSLIQKYIGLFGVPLCCLRENIYYVSKYNDIRTAQKSMKAHQSQYVWFRKLYILFSRYLYVNTFEEMMFNK
ncbi:N-acetylglucosaminyl-phosphatidylinositol de-N-acetylase-like isoform X2 [Stegodyphus dumicola]|uniref:N-acetylglucosaminyl-phosphatidylinositol de-N-acetylase-like isoform X2 n=1 Tax=Stegodyphus dumicola TaxID=202533 RepID=UPI0015AD9486|nr:N-acetylglucosaminyl-phosphatidylinositol de-N-acetylase-like isoform X2 [Stegodyphus dumicola]